MAKMKVALKSTRHLYINTDLANGGYFFKQDIAAHEKAGDLEGMKFRRMACVLMIAFATEARFNFLGDRLVIGWDERNSLDEKIRAVTKHVGVSADFGRRPYQTLKQLKDFRDTLAHGKPVEVTREYEAVTTSEELEKRLSLAFDWEKHLQDKFIEQAFADTEEVWRELLKLAGIDVAETGSYEGLHVALLEADWKPKPSGRSGG